MKKLLFSLVALVMVLAQPALTLAQTNGTSVVNSGDDANVSSSSTQTTTINVSNNNQAQVSQSVNASANTGGNTVDGNIALQGAGASINTGAATVSTGLSVDVNHNTTAISAPNMGGSLNSADVVNTGDDATVNTNVNNQTQVSVANNNSAYVNQMTSAYANTGKNNANDNIGGGSINTGAANVGTSMNAMANHSTTGIALGANGAGNGVMTNGMALTNTGDDASIHTNSNATTKVNVANSNMAMINQMVWGMSNTGKNSAYDNIGGGSIGTGPATVASVLGVNANHNMTGISGVGLFPTLLNLQDIVNTGDNLDSQGNNNASLQVNATNNNSLMAYQTVWSKSNTGWNHGNDNIGGGLLGTGAAGVGASYLLGGNHNSTLLGDILGLMSMLLS